jgi:hypothetical protein
MNETGKEEEYEKSEEYKRSDEYYQRKREIEMEILREKWKAEEKKKEEERAKDKRWEICPINDSRQDESEQINGKSEKWYVCPNGHCNEFSTCRWCGKSEVISRLEKDVPIFHKILYIGKIDGQYILTEDENIENKEENTRKIVVDYYSDYIFYFHMDGKNPHPFYGNTITLNDLSITGRKLTKMCEEIIDNKQKDMILE